MPIILQCPGEHNFHIFYYLLAGADDSLIARLQLDRVTAFYTYLNGGHKVLSPSARTCVRVWRCIG